MRLLNAKLMKSRDSKDSSEAGRLPLTLHEKLVMLTQKQCWTPCYGMAAMQRPPAKVVRSFITCYC